MYSNPVNVFLNPYLRLSPSQYLLLSKFSPLFSVASIFLLPSSIFSPSSLYYCHNKLIGRYPLTR